MTPKKIPQFELSTEGEITSVTFNFEDSVEFIEKQKKAYKLLAESTHIEFYIFDKDGNYILLNKDEL